MTKVTKIFVFLAVLLALAVPAIAGPASPVRYTVSTLNAEMVLDSAVLRQQVEFLCSPETGGRATGTPGAQKVALWLEEQFREYKLEPLSGTFLHGFRTGSGDFGRNVMGYIKGSAVPEKFLVVMAHFDNLGTLNGTFYPGADSNASGVAALLGLARMFAEMRECGKTYGHSILFVALDAKEQAMAGAAELASWLGKNGLQIQLVVNLDQLGTSLSPIEKNRPDYLIMLSEEADPRRAVLERANTEQELGLHLGFDYYGSKDFTALFFRRISEQRIFLERGIPAVMFTSGITLNNNKSYDTPDTLDYSLLHRRVRLIFHFLHRLL